MKTITKCLLIGMVFSMAVSAAVDHNPLSAGTTQNRNALGRAVEAPLHNPALLGVERPPRGGLLIAPLTNFGFGSWSDKLFISPFDTSISPFKNFWVDNIDGLSPGLTRAFTKSFDLEGLDPDQVSERLTEELKGGLKLYRGFRGSLLNIANNRVAFDITSHLDEEVTLPEGPLYTLFSGTKGLLRGSTLDFSNLREELIWATDFTLHLGLPLTIPALHDFFRLKYGAGGMGIKYVMGHSMLRAETERGTLTYSEADNAFDVDGKITIQTAGLGLSGAWNMEDMFKDGLPVSGHGIGVDLGGILYDDKGTLVINVQNLGVLFWMNNVRQVTYEIRKKDLDAYDILNGIEIADKEDKDPKLVIFNRDENEFLSDERDTLKESNGFATVLPLSINIGYSYSWDFSRSEKKWIPFLSDYANAGANYEQQLSNGPGRSFVPRLSLGSEVGALHGFLPLRLGFVFGGAEKLASAFGASINLKYVSFNASYKALGNLLLYPSRGMELAGGININWGNSVDTDKDGIIDRLDKCPTVAEDKDGFEDEDGCPDPDNDGDGICDPWVAENGVHAEYAAVCKGSDKCPNEPEDKDGFEDDDGCPEYDNDKDEIPDSLDKCPNDKEDRDNYEDQDGCPDYDNDGDGIPDSLDKCPTLPEDIDLFEDEDGCPDYDNDRDGIADTVDQCINDPETFNGYKDDDGCPDTLIKPTEKEKKVLNTKLRAINFKTASAEILPVSYGALDYIVGFLGQYPHLRYEIQGHTDSQGSDDYNLLLSAARAGTVRAYLLSKGVPDSNLIAIGYGESQPINDNATAKGRAINRRVDFRIVETIEQYGILKTQESLFRERVRDAKIKGAGY